MSPLEPSALEAVVGGLSRVTRTPYYEGIFADLEFHLTQRVSWDLPALAPLMSSSHTMLDVGCGWGRVALSFARAGVSVTGIERSRACLARLQRILQDDGALASRVQIVEGDILDDTLALDGRFDCAVFGDLTVNAFADALTLRRALGRALDVLTANGHICLTVLTKSGQARMRRYQGQIMATRFRDSRQHERIMWSTPDFDAERNTLAQDCLVQIEDADGPCYAFSQIRERMWQPEELVEIVGDLRAQVVERIPSAVQGGGVGGAETETMMIARM